MKKTKLKQLFLALISLLLIFSTVSCGTYKPPVDPGDDDDVPPVTPGPGDTTGGDDEDFFTVTLIYNGMTFVPDSLDVKAQWTDGYNYYQAGFDGYGTAKMSGLDGEYRVTLTEVPEGYTYDPNIHTASNDNRDIEIEIYRLSRTNGKGTENNPYKMTGIGVFNAEIKSSKSVIFFEFTPRTEGEYSIESWMDVTANEYNPRVDVYNANAGGWKQLREEVDGGGVSSGYTQNFLFKVQVAEEMIGNLFLFAIKVESKNDDYPVNVSFALKRDGHFELDHADRQMIIPEQLEAAEDYILSAEARENEKGTILYPVRYENGKRVLDGANWGYNEDSGFYQMYNPKSGKYDGEVLYMQVTSATVFLDQGIHTIEDAGNSALTVSDGTENYKLFIEGYSSLAELLYVGYENYVGIRGYADIVNLHGNVPVTREIKDFLQKFAISQLYFRDGNGWCEVGGITGQSRWMTDSLEEDQWLWACVYYG